MSDIAKILDALARQPIELRKGTPIVELDELVSAVVPHFGSIEWEPPDSYRAALARWGAFAAHRLVPAIDMKQGFDLLDADTIGAVNADLVHLPEGTSFDGSTLVTTNHLVGFAEAGHEAVWCFDVSGDGEYPVYYHHQDEPRARVLATGKWVDPDDARPDFRSFAEWLETMTAALTAPEPPRWLEGLGQPRQRFVDRRLSI